MGPGMSANSGSRNIPKETLYSLIADVIANKIDMRSFCNQFETTFNVETDKSTLSVHERSAFDGLFDKIVWYSSFPDERKEIPNYLDEVQVMDAVRTAIDQLKRAT